LKNNKKDNLISNYFLFQIDITGDGTGQCDFETL